MSIFTETAIPTDDGESSDRFNPAPEPEASGDLACEVCGKPLHYGGRGRKPRFCEDHKPARSATTSKRPITRTSSDVNAALAVMDQFYRGAGFLIYILATKRRGETPRPVDEWERVQVPRLLATDREIFTADPGLCKRINSLGARGGSGMFLFAHAMAVVPIVQLLGSDIAARRLAMQDAAKAAAAQATTPDGTTIPDKNAQYM